MTTPTAPLTTAAGDRFHEAPCCQAAARCICGTEERALRAYMAGQMSEPMTAEGREYCFAEIDRVEGHRRSDHEADSDADLARAVITAWTDYCQDKGLL